MLHKEIKEYLDCFDREQKTLGSIGEYEIAKTIKNIHKEDKNYEPNITDMNEQAAFDFIADYLDKNSGWGTYYGPMFVLPNEQGQMQEYPSIQRLTEETLNYWGKRAKETINPILSSRYADLVVDFSQEVLSKNADIDLFRIVIDSNIEICEKLLAHSKRCQAKIKRALVLAIKINDQTRIAKAKETIINFAKKAAASGAPEFSFQLLVLDPNTSKKITLDKAEKEELIKNLEGELKRGGQNAWLVENTVSLLAEYYAKEKDEDNLMRVLGVLESAFKADDRTDSDALLKISIYQKIHEVYQHYGAKGFQKASTAGNRISQEIGQFDLDVEKSLQRFPVKIEIPTEEFDAILKGIFGDDGQEKLETVVGNMAIGLLPQREKLENEFKDISEKNPLQFLVTTEIFSEDNILKARLAGLENDHEKYFLQHASQHMQFGSLTLGLVADKLKKQISKQDITNYFKCSLLFENEEYLERAISAYWDNDYLVSSHLFIPLIESAIRELIKKCGGTFLRLNDSHGYDRLTLHQLLKYQGEIIARVFSGIGQDMVFYFRLVLTEKLGMNLRNDFAHGLSKNKFFTREVSDRLFHIMLCLSSVERHENK